MRPPILEPTRMLRASTVPEPCRPESLRERLLERNRTEATTATITSTRTMRLPFIVYPWSCFFDWPVFSDYHVPAEHWQQCGSNQEQQFLPKEEKALARRVR